MNAEDEIESLTTLLHALLEEGASESTEHDAPTEAMAELPDEPDEPSAGGEGVVESTEFDGNTANARDAHPLHIYAPATLSSGDPVQFYEYRSSATLAQHLALAVESEGPVPEMVLFRRVARAWGLERTGSRIVERLRNLIPQELERTSEGGKTFYWPKDAQPTSWSKIRVCDQNDASRRHTDDVCLEELAGLALYVLKHAGTSPRIDVARSVCRLLGMAKTPAESVERVNAAVD